MTCGQVTTVDRYQGSQNDYIILSLVRTRHVGHLRDVRRLVVAMSRARLGLFVLARVSLFSKCRELTPAFTLVCHYIQLPCHYSGLSQLFITAKESSTVTSLGT